MATVRTMLGIESLLTKIAFAVFKKVSIGAGFAWLAKTVEIYSVFDLARDVAHCVDTTNDCLDLRTAGLHVLSDQLTDRAVDRLLDVGGTTYTVQREDSGLLVASSLAPAFRVPIDRLAEQRRRAQRKRQRAALRELLREYNDFEHSGVDDEDQVLKWVRLSRKIRSLAEESDSRLVTQTVEFGGGAADLSDGAKEFLFRFFESSGHVPHGLRPGESRLIIEPDDDEDGQDW